VLHQATPHQPITSLLLLATEGFVYQLFAFFFFALVFVCLVIALQVVRKTRRVAYAFARQAVSGFAAEAGASFDQEEEYINGRIKLLASLDDQLNVQRNGVFTSFLKGLFQLIRRLFGLFVQSCLYLWDLILLRSNYTLVVQPGLTGLNNLGNTCIVFFFFLSFLQKAIQLIGLLDHHHSKQAL